MENKLKFLIAYASCISILTKVSTLDLDVEENVVHYGYVSWSENNGYEILDQLHKSTLWDLKNVAWGSFENAYNKTGWTYLQVITNTSYPNEVQAYAAGYLEGYLTRDVIYMHWKNVAETYCSNKTEVCEKIKAYLETNRKWVDKMIKKFGDSDPYWHQVHLFYLQLEGLKAGWKNASAGTSLHIDEDGFLWLNILGDLEDLEQALSPSHKSMNLEGSRVTGSGSCSALVKLLPDNEDLYFSHVTWNGYTSMLRTLKRYSLGYTVVPKARFQIPGHTMTFSSSPGLIYSMDDFYTISSGLTTVETTIGNSNSSLWKFVKPRGQVLAAARTMVANRLATTGHKWSKTFSKFNSGTYNNQWMVVDYKLFKPGRAELPDNLLWVLEQIPGYVQARDVTYVLRKQKYWPSYNSPYFEDIFNMSGGIAMVQKYGDWFSYDKTPRALIFKRDHNKVVDLKSMTRLMRYNNFKHDPLSACECIPPYSAENAISARNDLNLVNGTYPFRALSHRSHGGTDMKLTNSTMALNLEFVSVCGPTYDNLPPFQWSKTDFTDLPHFGHPDLFAFSPIHYKWENL